MKLRNFFEVFEPFSRFSDSFWLLRCVKNKNRQCSKSFLNTQSSFIVTHRQKNKKTYHYLPSHRPQFSKWMQSVSRFCIFHEHHPVILQFLLFKLQANTKSITIKIEPGQLNIFSRIYESYLSAKKYIMYSPLVLKPDRSTEAVERKPGKSRSPFPHSLMC